MPNAIITGTGSYLPERRITNRDLRNWTFQNSKGEEYQVGRDEIITKTGIEERRYATSERTSDMAAEAGKKALDAAGIHRDDIDLVIVATSTPDYKIPKVAPLVATKIGMHGVPAYDYGKDCTGWTEAFEAASYFIMAGRYENIMVIGADKCSSFVNPRNKATAVIFGDGAGAAVVSATDEPERGFLSAEAGSQGESYDRLFVPVGGGAEPFDNSVMHGRDKLIMDGKSVAGYTSQVFAIGVERVLAAQQLVPENLDLLVPDQANLRIIEAGAKALDLPMSKVQITLDMTGNTAAASVPIALDEAVRAGKVKPGYLICLIAYGAGFSWISALMRW